MTPISPTTRNPVVACSMALLVTTLVGGAGLNPPKGAFVDDIQYTGTDGPSEFSHPLCPNTWRNGQKLGEAAAARRY